MIDADLRSASSYLSDHSSQLLALRDALQSGNSVALARVFAAVALAQGTEQMAKQADVDPTALFTALKDPTRLDVPLLAFVVARLAGSDALGDQFGGQYERP